MEIGERFDYSTKALQLSWNDDERFIKELLNCNIKDEDVREELCIQEDEEEKDKSDPDGDY